MQVDSGLIVFLCINPFKEELQFSCIMRRKSGATYILHNSNSWLCLRCLNRKGKEVILTCKIQQLHDLHDLER